MGRIDAPCSLKLPAPSRGLSCNHTLLQALALLSAAGLVGTSDAIRRRETAADAACCCCKRGRRVQSLAPSPRRHRRALLGSDVGWRRGDEASSPRVVHQIARRVSSTRSWSRLGDGGEAECWSIPLRPTRRVEPSKGHRRSSLREVLVRGSDNT